jgi:hypothetical protein
MLRRRCLGLVLAVPLALSSCGSDDATRNEDTAATVEGQAAAPFGLDAADLPDSESSLTAVFDALPDEVAGATRRPGGGGVVVEYDDGSGLFAALEPGSQKVSSMATFSDETGAEVEASNLDPSTGLVWLMGSFTDEGGAGLVHVAGWGDPDGDWVFWVNASSPAMREALVRAFVDATASADVEADAGVPLEDLRASLPSAAEISRILGVPDMSVEVSGGPGVIGSPALEYVEIKDVVGGWFMMFRPPTGFTDTGMIELTLLADIDEADQVTNQLLTDHAPDGPFVRSRFDVTDLLDDGQGYVLDPEPGSHFTRIDGRQGDLLIGVTIFHDSDDDRIEQSRAVIEAIVTSRTGQG